MEKNTVNYNNLKYLALIRFGHRIGCGWYAILVKAEIELRDLGYSIEGVNKTDGALIITTNMETEDLSSKAQNILYEAELASEMTCEKCGNYSVTQTSIDNELHTLCEGCQEDVGSLENVEKRLLKQKIHELERQILQMNQDMQIQENKTAHYQMGLKHYRERSERLQKELKTGYKKPKFKVVTPDYKINN